MRHIPKLTVVAVLLFLAALCGCCTGASTDIQVRSAAFTSETGRRWSASSAQMEELERAYAQARSVDSGWGTTPPATIDAILATGEAVRIMGGGQHFQTIVRDGRQLKVQGEELHTLLERIAAAGSVSQDDWPDGTGRHIGSTRQERGNDDG